MHPLKAARIKRNLSQEQLAEDADLSASTIKRAERGARIGAYARQRLCAFFGRTAEELDLVSAKSAPGGVEASPHSTLPLTHGTTEEQVVLIHNDHATRSARELSLSTALRRPVAGACFVLSALYLTEMVEDGSSLDPLLESLRVVLRGVQAMPIISRRQILQLGALALVPSIPIPVANRLTEEERIQLHQALGESIAAGWKLFHSAENAHVLAVGQAQYYLLQYVSAELYPSVRPMLYSGVHRLIGAALHFQGRYEEAYRAHEQAYITALEGGDSWNMAQSRSWQAYGLQALGRNSDALVIADGALRLISQQDDLENIRLRARLLAFSANNAALMGSEEEAQRRLSASEDLLERLPGPHEEFDRTAWLQEAGTCAMHLGQYQVAASRLQQALDEFPAHWALRSIETAVPLASTLIRMNNLDGALAIAQKTLPIVRTAQSHALTQKFIRCLHTELLTRFSRDDRCRAFIAQAEQQLPSA